MNLAESGTTTGDTGTSMDLHSDTRLHGRWLQALRVIWIALALTIVVLNVLVLPGVPASLLTPEVMRELHSLDFSPAFYTALIIGMNGVCMLLYLAMSALLFWRRSDDRMALFCSLTLLTFGGAVFGFLEYVPSTTLAWNLVASGLFFLGQVCFLSFFYLFPSGRFVPRWTRWAALIYALYWLASLSFSAFASGPPGSLLLVFLLTAVIAQVYRYRSVSTPGERQQTRWVVFGFVASIFLFLSTRLIPFLLPPDLRNTQVIGDLLGGISVYLSFMLIPIFIGIAILRAQLFDIDLIIKRTLVYGVLTACVVGIYVLVVGYLGALFHTGSSLVISLLATGLVAVLFQPLRGLLQRTVNRLLYGQRDEPYRVISRLGQRLEATVETDSILSVIVETVAQALKLPYAAISLKSIAATNSVLASEAEMQGSLLKQDEEFAIAASYVAKTGGASLADALLPRSETLLHLPLLYQSEQVGELLLAPRARGESFTPADRRLLDDLARQVGTVAHAVRLTADLQLSRERLVTAREEERRRLRRDLHDGLGPTLASIPLKLDAARNLLTRDPPAADALLVDLKKQTQTAVGDIRRLVYKLRPPSLDELGLIPALREQAEQYNQDGLHITLDAPEQLPSLPAAVEVAAYRIVQEALTNVVRHAQAHTCSIRFTLDNGLCMEVYDNGRGIPAGRRGGVGLTSIRERAAELGGTSEIEAIPAGGTRIFVRLPLPKE
jgi:signal transduction histidine kinase